MLAHVYATEAEARRAIRTIDAARGETEVLTLDGRSWEAPRKTWAHPVPLRDGTWCVPWESERLRAIEGRSVQLDGAKATAARERDAVTITDADRTREAEPDAPTRTR